MWKALWRGIFRGAWQVENSCVCTSVAKITIKKITKIIKKKLILFNSFLYIKKYYVFLQLQLWQGLCFCDVLVVRSYVMEGLGKDGDKNITSVTAFPG
jgi:hypothetical protein